MTENYSIQVSFKTPTQTLINLRASDEGELDELLTVLGRQLKGVGEIEQVLAGMTNIFEGLSPLERIKQKAEDAAAKPLANGPAQQAIQSGGGSPAGADAQMCRHGSMVWKEGTGKNGRAWKAWMCPSTNRADQCDPQWVRG